MSFATSWNKKESPAHLSAFFLMRHLSASELNSDEEEMEFPKLAELIFKCVGRRNEAPSVKNDNEDHSDFTPNCHHFQCCNLFRRPTDLLRILRLF